MFATALRLPFLVFAMTAAASDARFVLEAEVPLRGGAASPGFQTYTVPVVANDLGRICFQPMKGPGEFSIRSARLELQGRTVPIPLEDFEYSFQIAELNLRRDAAGYLLHVRTMPDATLPAVCLRDSDKRLEPARGLGPVTIWGAAIVSMAFVAFAALALAREVRSHSVVRFSRRDLLCLAALFALIASCKLSLVDRFASSMPYWDQWLLEWELLYRPYSQGLLSLTSLLAPHSEHRVPFVRLAAIVFLDVNGIWDVRVEAALDVLLQAATLTALAAIAWKLGGPRFQWPAMILTACAGALPIGVESATSGFHTQNFYQIVALAVLSLGLLALAKPFSPRWWIGFACSLLGGLVIASGALIPLAATGAIVARGKLGRRERLALVCLAGSACVGFALIGDAPHHDPLKPRSIAAFAVGVLNCLAWPMDTRPSAAPFVWAPLAALWARNRWKRREWTPLETLLASAGLWSALTGAALAYGRGSFIPSRYEDMLSPGVIANGLALVLLTARYPRAIALAIVWTGLLSAGFYRNSTLALREELSEKLERSRTQERNVARFLRDGDRAALYDKPFGAIPFPSAPMLDGYLRSPMLRAMLPPAIREPGAPLLFPGAGALSGLCEPVLRHAWIGVFASLSALFVLAGFQLRKGLFLFAAAALPVWSAAADARIVLEAEIPGTSRGFQTYRIDPAEQTVGALCFRPIPGAGQFKIRSARLELPGRTAVIALEDLQPHLDIAEITLRRSPPGYELHVRTNPAARIATLCVRDPAIYLSTATRLGRGAIWSLASLFGAIVVLSSAALAREIRGRESVRFSCLDSWRCAALAILIVCAKFTIVDRFATALPTMDQWQLQWDSAHRLYANGQFSFSSLMSPHNEHRLPLLRIASIVLLDVNGIWNARLESAIDALLHTAVLTGFAIALWKLGGQRYKWPALILCGSAGVAQFAWESTAAGLHMQNFYQILLFAFLALGLLSLAEPLSRRWWLGWLCSLCAGLAIASGALVPIAAFAIALLRGSLGSRRTWTALALLAASAAAGLALIGSAPQHAEIKARSLEAVARAMGMYLAWPLEKPAIAAFALWLPFAAMLAGLRFGRGPGALDRFLLATGAWTILNAAAFAYGRGGSEPAVSSRYCDLLAPGFLVNGCALVLLMSRSRRWLAFAPVWIALLGAGLFFSSHWALRVELPGRSARYRVQEENTARFVRHGDRAALHGQPLWFIPFPDPVLLEGYLRSPTLRTMLPPVVREPDVPLPFPGAGWMSSAVEAVLPRAWIPGFAAGLALALQFLRDIAASVRKR